MKTSFLLLLTGSIVAATALPVLAQIEIAGRPAEAVPESVVAIHFEGGTLAEYIAMVRKAFGPTAIVAPGKPTNIFVHENARDVRVPSVNITTNLVGALGILQMLSSDEMTLTVRPDPSGNVKVIQVIDSVPAGVDVISVNKLLEHVGKEKLLSAVEIGLEMLGKKSSIEMKLHEETGLLFVKGQRSETDVVRAIAGQLSLSYENNISAINRFSGRSAGGRGSSKNGVGASGGGAGLGDGGGRGGPHGGGAIGEGLPKKAVGGNKGGGRGPAGVGAGGGVNKKSGEK